MIGQMMEPVEFKESKKEKLPEKTWAQMEQEEKDNLT